MEKRFIFVALAFSLFGCMGLGGSEGGDCSEFWDQTSKDSCFYKTAVTRENSTICKSVMENSLRDSCYYHVAEETGNSSSCDKVADWYRRDTCYYYVSIAQRDHDGCDQIRAEGRKETCHQEILATPVVEEKHEKTEEKDEGVPEGNSGETKAL